MHQCRICSKVFSRADSLKRHMEVHSRDTAISRRVALPERESNQRKSNEDRGNSEKEIRSADQQRDSLIEASLEEIKHLSECMDNFRRGISDVNFDLLSRARRCLPAMCKGTNVKCPDFVNNGILESIMPHVLNLINNTK